MPKAEAQTMSWRDWLLSETPGSPRQARLGRFYAGWLDLRTNRLAMVGLGIMRIAG